MDHNWKEKTERAGDEAPEEAIPQPDGTWQQHLGYIAIALGLTGITLNIVYLQYILPTIGYLVLYIQMRKLRIQGDGLRTAWKFSGAMAVLWAAAVILEATPYLIGLRFVLGIVFTGLRILFLISLRTGLSERFGDEPSQSDPLMWLLVLHIAMTIFGLIGLGQFLPLAIAFIIGYIFLLTQLCTLGDELDALGIGFTEPDDLE